MSGAGDGPSLADHVERGCLSCGGPDVGPVLVLHAEGALPGTPDHDFAYEHDVVVACEACGALRLETWRHDCFDFESWFDRRWHFPLEGDDADRLRSFLEGCPDPMEPGCGCPIHRSLAGSLDGLPPRDPGADRTVGVRRPIRVEERPDGPRFAAG